MEKLFKRADGYSEASDGKFAIVPLRRTGIDSDFYFFTFKPTFNSQAIRVEWPTDSAIAIIPSETAITMVRLNHARNLTKEEVEQYNESVDFDDKDDDKDSDKDSDEAEAARIAAEELETKRLEAETAEAAEKKRLEAEAAEAAEAADEDAEGEDDETADEGTEKPKRGRKKKETETPVAPIGIPGLTS